MGTRRNKVIAAQHPEGLSAPLRQERFWLKIHRADAWRAQSRRCKFCREPISLKEATADHKLARKNGGTTTSENIQVACADCNSAKGHKTDLYFKKAIRNPQPEDTWAVWRAWSRRTLWARAEAANLRLMRMVGLET